MTAKALSLAAAIAVGVALGGPGFAQAAVPSADQRPSNPSGDGKALFQVWCSGCHMPLGPYVTAVAGTSALEKLYKGSKPAALEQRTDLTPGYVKTVVRHGMMSMPFFRKTEIGDADLDVLAAYLAKAR